MTGEHRSEHQRRDHEEQDIIDREAVDDPDGMSGRPWWRKLLRWPPRHSEQHSWVVRKAIRNPVVTTIIIFSIFVYLPVLGLFSYTGYCLVDYLKEDRRAQEARDYLTNEIRPLRDESDRIELKIYSQTADQQDYARKREVLDKIVRLGNLRQEEIDRHPPPDFPVTLCGLIQTGGVGDETNEDSRSDGRTPTTSTGGDSRRRSDPGRRRR